MYDLIVVGAGPAGLSAACHAHKNGMKVLVIEKGEIANTIFEYPKGKHVMAEPAEVPLRGGLSFGAGRREALLRQWGETVASDGVEIRRPEEVQSLSKSGAVFTVKTNGGEYASAAVILAIGTQGNPRKLNVPGSDHPDVLTRLDDPAKYVNEDILVVGAGDAAIEAALALSERNRVTVVNRSPEFYKLKDALFRDISKKVEMKQVAALHSAAVERIAEQIAYVKVPDRVVEVKVSLVLVRIGTEIPRPFLERVGVRFASSDPKAPPMLSAHHETSVPGLYLIGAVSGKDLIKLGMNQGYDVVEHVLGHTVEPVEEPIIRDQRLSMLQGSTAERLNELRSLVPFLADVPDSALRDVVLSAKVHGDVKARTAIYREDHYSDSLFIILRGAVRISKPMEGGSDVSVTLGRGSFFGEMSLVSGLRRSEKAKSIEDTVLFEIPRRAILRLMSAEPSVKQAIDEHFVMRALQLYLLPDAQITFLRSLAARATTRPYKQGQIVYKATDVSDVFYLVRSGSMKVTMSSGGRGGEVVVNHLPVGRCFGHLELMSQDQAPPARRETVTATKDSEVIQFRRKDFSAMLERYPEVGERLRHGAREAIVRQAEVSTREAGDDHRINRLVDAGVFEGTDVLLIDEDKCTRCDQCVSACAATHDGQTRLYRTKGNIFGNLLVPSSCRHCENPKCMTDCPPGDAILRHKDGQVYINPTKCIGCGNCATNCPYGNIFMVHPQHTEPVGPLDRLLELIGVRQVAPVAEKAEETKAVKCDLCRGSAHGPACVRICPTGAATRVSPNEYFKGLGVGVR